MAEVDLGIFDKKYPVVDGIVDTRPANLRYETEPNSTAAHFFDVHRELAKKSALPRVEELLSDKTSMALLQKEFYDQFAQGFQKMDDNGGTFWWKIARIAKYDERFLGGCGTKLLFVGAGNCRFARIFAKMGYDVVATDISINMLRIGKEINDKLGIEMTYVAQNAEEKFPFKSAQFDSSYSLCVQNHIVDWRNYITEKIRCLKAGGILLERLPNATLWSFWRQQGELYDGVEAKAQYCNPDNIIVLLQQLGLGGRVWTHDRQTEIDQLRLYIPRHLRVFRQPLSKAWYDTRTFWEDRIFRPQSMSTRIGNVGCGQGRHGIYTVFLVRKN